MLNVNVNYIYRIRYEQTQNETKKEVSFCFKMDTKAFEMNEKKKLCKTVTLLNGKNQA